MKNTLKFNKIFVIFLAVFCCFVLVGCLDDTDPPTPEIVSVSVVSNNSDYGTVSGGGDCIKGNKIVISATANDGYYFDAWNDGNTNASRQVTATKDATYTAIFKEGNLEIVNGYKVVAVNGTIENKGSYIAFTAKNKQTFGYWYTTNQNVAVEDGPYFTITTNSINSDVTYTAFDSHYGFGFVTLKNNETNFKPSTFNDFVIMASNLGYNYAYITPSSMRGSDFELTSTTNLGELTIYSYTFKIQFNYPSIAICRFYKINNEIKVSSVVSNHSAFSALLFERMTLSNTFQNGTSVYNYKLQFEYVS